MSNEPDEVNSGALATTIILVAFATLAVALVVTALVRDETAAVHQVKDVTQERAYRELKADQMAALHAVPAWTDRASGSVSVPIESAMARVISDVRADRYALTPKKPGEEDEPTIPDEGEVTAEADEATEGASQDESGTGGETVQQAAAPDVAPAPTAASAAPRASSPAAPAPPAKPEPKAAPEPKAPPQPKAAPEPKAPPQPKAAPEPKAPPATPKPAGQPKAPAP